MKAIKGNIILTVAIGAALLSAIFIKPDKRYAGYIDYYTLGYLFCNLAIIAAYRNIYFFRIVARKIIGVFKTSRKAIIALVYITFIGSMAIANDMALITFLPLGYYVLFSTNNQKYVAFTFIMQTIAANLGGMLTPFGNPQNLFLYSYFHIGGWEFIKIMFPPFILSIIMITVCCLFVKNEKLIISESFDKELNVQKTIVYTLLFLLFLLMHFYSS